MKKLLITITLVLFSSSAFAGSCNMLVGKIDDKIQQVIELREAGKKDMKKTEDFMARYYQAMPRVMLRYAIEQYPESKRQKYLKGKI